MSTITLILDPDADGSLHLPLPDELRHGKVKVTATLEAASGDDAAQGLPPRATPEMIERRLAAFARLRVLDPFRDVGDAVAWQREIRRDRILPGGS